MNREPDWTLWRSFLAVIDAGSLSGAARELGSSQPTLGRHMEALEADLGLGLFDRTLNGLRPNPAALRLAEKVREARTALAAASLLAEGAAQAPSGTVRITSSEVVTHYVLPQVFTVLRQRFPDIAFEIVPSDAVENLLLREADIAVRIFRPTQLDLVARKLGDIHLVAAAHEDYLSRRGTPQSLEELRGHDVLGFDQSEQMIQVSRQMGLPLQREDFAFRTDSQTAMWELAKAGAGIVFGQIGLVEETPGMVRILPGFTVPLPMEIWLTTHRELLSNARVRRVYDALAELVAARLARRPITA